jgi:cell division protein FtsI/penicillin-binding protein 2
MLFRKRRKIKNTFVEPDEIFLDSQNLPDFDTQQMKNRLERSIPKSAFWVVFGLLGICLLIFTIKLLNLQVISGSNYAKQSEKNRLAREPIFADRGVIYDRNNVDF